MQTTPTTRTAAKRTPPIRTQPIENVVPNMDEVIRMRAYSYFQARVDRGLPGDALADWLRAEREVRTRALR